MTRVEAATNRPVSKAQTLCALQSVLRTAVVLPLFRFGVNDWNADRALIVTAVRNACGDGALITPATSEVEMRHPSDEVSILLQ